MTVVLTREKHRNSRESYVKTEIEFGFNAATNQGTPGAKTWKKQGGILP